MEFYRSPAEIGRKPNTLASQQIGGKALEQSFGVFFYKNRVLRQKTGFSGDFQRPNLTMQDNSGLNISHKH
jgi:hypothetical protein